MRFQRDLFAPQQQPEQCPGQHDAQLEQLQIQEVQMLYKSRVQYLDNGIEIITLDPQKDRAALSVLSLPFAQEHYTPEYMCNNPLLPQVSLARDLVSSESMERVVNVAQQQGFALALSIVKKRIEMPDGSVVPIPTDTFISISNSEISIGGPIFISLFHHLKEGTPEQREAVMKAGIKAILRADTRNNITIISIPTRKDIEQSPTHKALTDPDVTRLPGQECYLLSPEGTNTRYFFANGEYPQNVALARQSMRNSDLLERVKKIGKQWNENFNNIATKRNDAGTLMRDHARLLFEHYQRLMSNSPDDC